MEDGIEQLALAPPEAVTPTASVVPIAPSTEVPDWVRLQKALAVEAEHGFNDLVGRQSRFSEFLAQSLQQAPEMLPTRDRRRWQEVANQFANYSDLSFAQRQHLVADTRRFLYQVRQNCERTARSSAGENGAPPTPKQKSPKTAPLNEPQRPINPDEPLTYLPGIGPKNAERLAKLGLYTVRDL
ncbi:MAG TPA: hypothetical protein V6C63_14830, partial [Allocoleopsis sp.]